MKSSSHGRFTSAILVFSRFTLHNTMIVVLSVSAALTFTTLDEPLTEIGVSRGTGRTVAVTYEPRGERSMASAAVRAITDPVPRTIPYAEDFSILAHSASAYPAGWGGAQVGAGTSAGSAPTFKTIEPTTDLTLTANSSASSTAGAVHNFNGKIGFLSTGSADPSLMLAIETTGLTNTVVAFDAMTIRNPYNGTTNTRIGELDLQFRVCTALPCAGSFASASAVAGIYRNNTTPQTSGTTPQNTESKMITLPAATNDRAYVQLRWVQRDVSGTGARPSFAIDNVSVTASSLCTEPMVTIEPVNQDATYGVASVSFTSMASGEPAPSVQWQVDAGAGFVDLANEGSVSGADTTTLNIFAPDVAMNGYAFRAVFSNACGTTPSVASNSAILSVAPRAVTVTPDAGQTKIYGDADPILTYEYSPPLVFSDSFTGELAREPGHAAGGYGITAGTLSLGANYSLAFTDGVSFEITPRELAAAIAAESKIYDGTNAATFVCSLSGVIAPDVVNCSAGTASFADLDVGSHTVSVTGLEIAGADSANYYLPVTTATDDAEILVRPITVSAITGSKEYDGGVNSSATPIVTEGSIADGDMGAFTQSYATRDAGAGKTIVASGIVNDGNGGNNYAVTFVDDVSGVITPKPIIVTAVEATKPLDGNNTSTGIPTVEPALVSGDTPNFIQVYDTPFPGIGKTLTPSGVVVDGNGGMNYSYTFVSVHTGVITATYCFEGFHSPIGGSVENGNGGTFANPVRAFKLNSTIPIKFTLYAGGCGGMPVTTGVHTLQLIKYANTVDSDPAIDATPSGAATSGNQFRLAETEWHFNLDTKKTPGITTGTWLIRATLFDGSVKTVWVSIKK